MDQWRMVVMGRLVRMVRAGGDVVGGLLIECSGECSEDGSDGGDGIER